MEIIPYLKTLSHDDWYLKVTDKWLVKDVVSHLVGWEREVSNCFLDAWKNKNEPWFIKSDNYEEINQKIYDEFKKFNPEELLKELQKWSDDLNSKIEKVGMNNLEKRRVELDWVLDYGDDSHFLHHLNQIKKAVENK